MFKQPVIFTKFCGKDQGSYVSIPDMVTLKSVLDGKLQEYNESNPMMDLVLFDKAMVSGGNQSRSFALKSSQLSVLSLVEGYSRGWESDGSASTPCRRNMSLASAASSKGPAGMPCSSELEVRASSPCRGYRPSFVDSKFVNCP